MNSLTLTLKPLSPFGSRLEGDTLFGQLCWTLHNTYGQEKLATLLEGYTENRPFAVVSDAFPQGYVGRPDLPVQWFASPSGDDGRHDRKAMKKRVWLPLQALQNSSSQWHRDLADVPRLAGGGPTKREKPAVPKGQHVFLHEVWQPHNQIDRRTGTTGMGDEGFAPFVMPQWRYGPGTTLHVHVCFDPKRIEAGMLEKAFRSIGALGYGADASTGMGRFRIESVETPWLLKSEQANAWLALAPCAPQQRQFDPERSWYRVFTRFGRHGDVAALSSAPFKNPVLLTRSGAVFSPRDAYSPRHFVGRGLGGGEAEMISRYMPETVHQGYAPVTGIQLDGRKKEPT